MTITLTGKARASLKARAHGLNPLLQLGHAGLTETFVAEVDRALTAHELIKVRIGGDDRDAREATCDDLCARLGAASVQRVGKILVLWRPRPDED
jgi:putative YhbY family RNA-binding protein